MNEKTPIMRDVQLKVMDDPKDDFYPQNPFGENFDKQFWIDVSALNATEENWSASLLKTRLKRLRDKCDDEKDIIVYLMEIHDRFVEKAQQRNETEYLLSFIQQVSEFVCQVLNEDYEKKKKRTTYSQPIEVNDEIEKTVLHFAAERNLDVIAKATLMLYPRQCYRKCLCGGAVAQTAVELALDNYMDDTGHVLVNQMNNASVRSLFEYDEVNKTVKYSFSAMATDKRMRKTVIGILDCLINPEFPFVPQNPDNKNEDAWSKIPNKPQRYHVYYRILDGDSSGRAPHYQGGTENPDFEFRSDSGLHSVVHSPFCEDIISHPAVRLLVQRKWGKYGAMWIWFRIISYLVFLMAMSVAFFITVKDGDRTKYETDNDRTRMVFEIITFLMAIYYAIIEIDQMAKEGKTYWKQGFNYIDLLGILLVLVMLPIKFLQPRGQRSEIEWSVASVAYLVNMLRIFQWFPAIRYLGIFIVLIQKLLYHDLPKFLAVYCVFTVAFTGSIILALRAYADGFSNADIGPWAVFLKEIRALTESNPFADDYIGYYRTVVIILIIVNMFACILLMTNILIANLSNAYTDAQLAADLQCGIDRATTISRLEYSWIRNVPCLPKMFDNQRIRYYTDAEYVGSVKVKEVTEMISYWEDYRNKLLQK